MIKRSLSLAGLMIVLLLPVPAVEGAGSYAPKLPPPPHFDAANFHNPTHITNRFYPLIPDTTYVYRTTVPGETQRNVMQVTEATKVILGVRCVVVHDKVTVGGALVEDTYDWYAQDDAGNVWYMGEDTKEYENGKVVSTAGSWEAGVKGAQPGFIMEAHPEVGDVYRQEYLKGEAEDAARVVSLTASASSPYHSYQDNLLQTQETSVLDPGVVEQKYYAAGVGMVRSELTAGGPEVSVLLSVTHDD